MSHYLQYTCNNSKKQACSAQRFQQLHLRESFCKKCGTDTIAKLTLKVADRPNSYLAKCVKCGDRVADVPKPKNKAIKSATYSAIYQHFLADCLNQYSKFFEQLRSPHPKLLEMQCQCGSGAAIALIEVSEKSLCNFCEKCQCLFGSRLEDTHQGLTETRYLVALIAFNCTKLKTNALILSAAQIKLLEKAKTTYPYYHLAPILNRFFHALIAQPKKKLWLEFERENKYLNSVAIDTILQSEK